MSCVNWYIYIYICLIPTWHCWPPSTDAHFCCQMQKGKSLSGVTTSASSVTWERAAPPSSSQKEEAAKKITKPKSHFAMVVSIVVGGGAQRTAGHFQSKASGHVWSQHGTADHLALTLTFAARCKRVRVSAEWRHRLPRWHENGLLLQVVPKRKKQPKRSPNQKVTSPWWSPSTFEAGPEHRPCTAV